MSKVAYITVGLIAVAHVLILVFEMFLWDKPAGLWAFDMKQKQGFDKKQKQEYATASKSLAANQGLYNGFLAAGLFWGLRLDTQGAAHGTSVTVFFLCCVLIAGLYGAATTKKIKILFIQTIPAALALALVCLS